MALVADTRNYLDSYLPDECWSCVFKFLHRDDNDINNRRYLKPLSLVSKQFLSITNRLLFSLAVCESTRPLLSCLLHRFTNLTSLDLTCCYGDFNTLLCQISSFPLKLTSLKLSNLPIIPANGLRVFSQNITTLTSLTCSNMDVIYNNNNDLFFIVECFPLLEELDLSDPLFPTFECFPLLEELDLSDPLFPASMYRKPLDFCDREETLLLSLFKLSKLRKINISGHDEINDQSLLRLFKNCNLLEEVIMFNCLCITIAGIASAICERPTLRSLSFSNCDGSNISTMLLALIQNSPSLDEIRMKYTYMQKNILIL